MNLAFAFFFTIVFFVSCLEVEELRKESLNEFTYSKMGSGIFSKKDWPGMCGTGTRQSPINIIEGINTEESESGDGLEFKYNLPEDFAAAKEKIFFTGKTLEMRANIGELIFKHKDNTRENYKVRKIVFHYPSEHTLTKNGQSPRYPLEMQIYHTLTKTTNEKTTHKHIQVKQAIVSILFKDDSLLREGDQFLSRLGIEGLDTRPDGTYKTVDEKLYIDVERVADGNNPPYFDYDALMALLNTLNSDHHIFRYYGSDTMPPCMEEIHWIVFANPRSISKSQVNFLRQQLMKENKGDAKTPFYGNNRVLQPYDDASNGKIVSLKNGISTIEGIQVPII